MVDVQYRMHPDIQRFPNIQFYDGALKCGLRTVLEQVIGIPWPRAGKTEYKGGQDTGQLTPEQEPHHRMLYIHCEGQESTEPNSSSLVNEEQADAAAHVVLCILEQSAERTF